MAATKDTGKSELEFILNYVADVDLNTIVSCGQLRSLWTAYCLHQNVDISTYRSGITTIWAAICQNRRTTHKPWVDFDEFCGFMTEYF